MTPAEFRKINQQMIADAESAGDHRLARFIRDVDAGRVRLSTTERATEPFDGERRGVAARASDRLGVDMQRATQRTVTACNAAYQAWRKMGPTERATFKNYNDFQAAFLRTH